MKKLAVAVTALGLAIGASAQTLSSSDPAGQPAASAAPASASPAQASAAQQLPAPQLPASMQPPSQQAIANDPSGLTALIGQELSNCEIGGTLGAADGITGAATYLPLKTIHSAAKADGSYDEIWGEINLAGETRKHQAGVRGLAFADVNVVWLSSYLWRGAWAQSHVTGSNLPPILVGFGPSLPIDYQAIRALTWNDVKKDMRITLSVKFGTISKALAPKQ